MVTSPTGHTSDRLASLFPDPNAPSASKPWWRDKRRLAFAVAAAVAVSALVATQAFGAGTEYRTAAAAKQSVDATLQGVATIEPVSQATVAFPVSGTVKSVAVKLGDKVTGGQRLASLDPQSLETTLHSKQAALAQAQLSLEQALSGQAVTGGRTSISGVSPAVATSQSLRSDAGSGDAGSIIFASAHLTSSDPDLAAKQQAVLDAQQNVDTAIAAATNAMNSATTVCASLPDAAAIAACQTALSDVSAAQVAVKTAQDALVSASNALDTLLQQLADASPSGSTPSTTGGASTPSGRGGGSGGASFGGGGSSATAADLVAYQKAVDAAYAEVLVAQQAVSQATIASPLDGTVVAVNLAVGDAVTAASSSSNIVVQGAGGFEVGTTVSVDKIKDVRIGQSATVAPDGNHRVVMGKVAYISVVPATTGATSSYLVVVSLSRSTEKFENGSAGTVTIVTGHAKNALAVPTSAVTTVGTRHTVQVLDGDSTKTVSVKVGVVSERWTEITSGLTAGDFVVLADLSAALPGSATSSSNTTGVTGLRGTFPGGFGGASPIRGR